MRSSQPHRVPSLFTPPQVKKSALSENEKILDDFEIAKVEGLLTDSEYGRYCKKFFNTSYGIYKGEKSIYAIYRNKEVLKDRVIIGYGGFGKVRLAQDLHTGKWYALKIEKIDKNHPKCEFKAEAKILADLDILIEPPKYRETKLGYNKGYLLMELAEGKTLWKFLRDSNIKGACGSNWSDRMWLNVANRIVENIYTNVHLKGYFHCDLKTENIMISDMGKITLIDFGLSVKRKLLENGTYDNKAEKTIVAGTERYFAPEISKGWHDEKDWPPYIHTESMEIFALGKLLQEILFNQELQPCAEVKEAPCIYKFKSLGKKRIFEDNEEIKNFLSDMQDPNPTIRPTFREVKNFLLYLTREYDQGLNQAAAPKIG